MDFTKPHEEVELIEEVNPYIQAKMTYRLEHIIIRQAEFSLDFPIFFTGGLGTDFELMLECLRIQVGMRSPAPILLFGSPDYWKQKITPKYQLNRKTGTIKVAEHALVVVNHHMDRIRRSLSTIIEAAMSDPKSHFARQDLFDRMFDLIHKVNDLLRIDDHGLEIVA